MDEIKPFMRSVLRIIPYTNTRDRCPEHRNAEDVRHNEANKDKLRAQMIDLFTKLANKKTDFKDRCSNRFLKVIMMLIL